MTTPSRPVHFQNWRFLIVYGLIGVVAVIFITRLFNLQILNKGDYVLQAEDNRTETISEAPSRGIIYDRNGITLARTRAQSSYGLHAQGRARRHEPAGLRAPPACPRSRRSAPAC